MYIGSLLIKILASEQDGSDPKDNVPFSIDVNTDTGRLMWVTLIVAFLVSINMPLSLRVAYSS